MKANSRAYASRTHILQRSIAEHLKRLPEDVNPLSRDTAAVLAEVATPTLFIVGGDVQVLEFTEEDYE